MRGFRQQWFTGVAFGRMVEWRVGALLDWAREHGIQPTRLPLSLFWDHFCLVKCDEPIGSRRFLARAQRADLQHPILVACEDDSYLVADGSHRLWKAMYLSRRRTILALVLPASELPDTL